MKRLYKLEQQIGKYGERLVAQKLVPKQQSNKWIVEEIRTMLDQKMAVHSSKPELTQHFTELFSGLEKIGTPSELTFADPLDAKLSEQQIMQAFDERYYRGLATFALTTKILADKRVHDPQHLMRAVAQGGTISSSWTNAQRQLFGLHAANKLWVLGDRTAARAKLLTDYVQFWRSRSATNELNERDLRLLTKALVNTHAVPSAELVGNIDSNWRSSYVVWQNAYRQSLREQITVEADHTSSWPASNHVGAALVENASNNMPRCLPEHSNFVPLHVSTAPQQIKRALLRHAQQTRDEDSLDISLALEDESTEAAVIAAKIASA